MLDYIIVGQGLAGSLLSYFLLKHNKKILVIDNDEKTSSSKVAAGIFNPITGKRKVKTWQADLLFDFLNEFYPLLEKELGETFFYKKPVYMLFDSIEEQNYWAGKIADPLYKNFLEVRLPPSAFQEYIQDNFGGILAENSGYIDLNTFLKALKRKLVLQEGYLKAHLDTKELIIEDQKIIYGNHVAKRIIFCEGYQISENPYFNWLPFNLVKGELLELEVEEIPDIIFNKNIFILPLNRKHCLAGSTYSWDDRTMDTTIGAKVEIQSKIDQLLKIDYKIINQRAGIRPATKDRRPYLGIHPKFKNVFVFGGLGTKGVSIGPYYAQHFFDYLENGKELERDVNINRHYSLYYLNNSL